MSICILGAPCLSWVLAYNALGEMPSFDRLDRGLGPLKVCSNGGYLRLSSLRSRHAMLNKWSSEVMWRR